MRMLDLLGQEFTGKLFKRKDYLDQEEEAKTHPNRTYYFRRHQSVERLIEQCTKLVESAPPSPSPDPKLDKALYRVLFIRARSYMKKKEYKSALKDLGTLLRSCTDDVAALYLRGVAHEKLGMLNESIKDFSKVLELDPNHVNAAYARAACYNRKGMFDSAINDYNLALSKDKPEKKTPATIKSPTNHQRTGSFAMGVEEYCRTREKDLREQIVVRGDTPPP